MRLQLPTSSKAVMGAFTSLSGGEIVSFGALRDNFGGPLLSLKLIEGWSLNRVGFGVCRENPVKVRGDIGISMLSNRFTRSPIEIDGRWTYTAQHKFGPLFIPWTVELNGKAEVIGQKVGTGRVVITANSAYFSLDANVSVARGLLKVKGGVTGWLNADHGEFGLEGSGLQACIESVCSPRAKGIVTNTGVGACIDVGKVKIFGETIRVRAGGGTKWAEPTDIKVVGGRCGFRRYRSFTSRAAQGAAPTFQVASKTPAVAVRIVGTTGPPKVRVTGPSFDVSSPATESGRLEEGSYALMEDRSTRSTHLILVNREPGTYSVQSLDADNPVRAVQTAGPERPFSSSARVLRARKGVRELRLRYRKPEGAALKLVERGKRTTRTLVNRVAPKRCGKGSTRLCAKVRFRPAAGPGGKRTIEAILERDGIPLATERVATYRAPAQARPSKPRVRILRRGSTVRIAWTRAKGAASYTVIAKLSDGRQLAFTPERDCRTVHIRGVGRGLSVSARVNGLRKDLRAGRPTRQRLKPKQRRSGSRSVRLRKSCA